MPRSCRNNRVASRSTGNREKSRANKGALATPAPAERLATQLPRNTQAAHAIQSRRSNGTTRSVSKYQRQQDDGKRGDNQSETPCPIHHTSRCTNESRDQLWNPPCLRGEKKKSKKQKKLHGGATTLARSHTQAANNRKTRTEVIPLRAISKSRFRIIRLSNLGNFQAR